MMLTQTQVQQFRAQGYLNGGRILDDATVDKLREEVMRVIDERDRTDISQPLLVRNLGGDDNAPVWQIVNIWQASEHFKALVTHPQIVTGIAQLTGEDSLRIWHDQIQYKPPRIGGVNMWHQDAPYWPIIEPMSQVTAWVALDNVDEANGCMSMVLGSHLWGNNIDFLHTLKNYEAMPSEYKGKPIKIIHCPVKKGDVHFHHALTWHGSHANQSGRPRRAIALHYMAGNTRYVARGEHVMKPFVTVNDGERIDGGVFFKVYP